MSRRRSSWLFLADLVMAVLVCGLIMALFTGVRGLASGALVCFLLFVVGTCWVLFHQQRHAATCEECGRRFIPSQTKNVSAACPHCGERQVRRSFWSRRTTKIYFGLLGLMLLLLGSMSLLITGFAGGPFEDMAMLGAAIAFGLMHVTVLAMAVLLIYSLTQLRPKDRPCAVCGTIIPLKELATPKLCPQCRVRHLRPDEAQKEQVRSFSGWLVLLGIVAAVGSFIFSGSGGPRSDASTALRIFLLVVGFFVAGFSAFAVFVVLNYYLRRRQLRSERSTLAAARKCTGQEGEVVADGPLTVWYSGPDDPLPMLREQFESARRRFERLTPATAAIDAPCRIFVFHDHRAFIRFHERSFPGVDFGTFSSLYLERPYRLATLCLEPGIGAILETERTIRSIGAYALLESVLGPAPTPWLQSGLTRTVTDGEDRDRLTRLNRKMVASLSSGAAFSADLFTITRKDVGRLIRGSKYPDRWQKLQLLDHQSWSVLEYLCGEPAPEGSRNALGAFLHDPLSKTHQEDSFRQRFGRSFETCLEGWRQWVLDRGIGTYDPPPEGIRAGLLQRVLPTIRDQNARRGHRIVAIRNWGDAGFVLGSDALIDLLREPGDIPNEEIVWALRMVSGMAWGDEPERWRTWWDDLPQVWDERPVPAETQTDDPAMVT
jgi:predicted RNA-binding Zn-ribbon protein involved in translation (DUF1610 family)